MNKYYYIIDTSAYEGSAYGTVCLTKHELDIISKVERSVGNIVEESYSGSFEIVKDSNSEPIKFKTEQDAKDYIMNKYHI